MSPSTAPDPGALDPALRQTEPRRPRYFGLDLRRLRRIRRIAFAVLALPLLALGLLCAKFISMPLTQAWHDGAYDQGSYAEASDRLEPVLFANWFEPYLPYLTRGTDLLQQGQDAAAEEQLRTSLEKWEGARDLNQPQHAMCKIRNNLAIAIERQAAGITDPAARADRLFEAEQIIAPCASGGGGGGDGSGGGNGDEDEGTTGGNGERIEQERREADEQAGNDPDARDTGQGGDPGDEPGGGGAPDPGDPVREDPSGQEPPEEAPTQGDSEEQQRQEELEQRNRDANQGDTGEESSGAPQDPVRPW